MSDGKIVYEVQVDDGKVKGELSSVGSKISAEAKSTSDKMEKEAKETGDEISKQAQETGEDVNNATDGVSTNFSSKLSGMAKVAGASFAAIGAAAIAVGTAAVTSAVDLDQAVNQFSASTGTAQEEMGAYEETLKNIYANNYGESFEDIANKMGLITQQIDGLDQASLQNLTEGLYTLEDTFGSDFNETLRGADQLMTQFGISSEEALDLLVAGSQAGLDYTSELGDNVAEYAGKFAQAGYSAEEYFQLLANGAEGGSYNLDKVNDAINEVTTKLADGSISDAIGLFSNETQGLFEQWQAGGATQKEVIDSIIQDISSCTNEQEALTMAATAFGTMGEDANLEFIESLSSVGDEFSNVKGKMEEVKEVKYDDLGSMLEGLKRSLELLLIPLGETLVPAIAAVAEQLMPIIEELLPPLSDILGTLIESVLPPMLEVIEAILPPIVQLVQDVLPPIIELIEEILPPLMEIVEMLLPPLVELAEAIITPLTEILGAILPPLIEVLQMFIEPLVEFYRH